MNKAYWLKFSVFNFCIVALIGVLMRYKIAYSLPFLDQKFLQHGHSHFAFYGWITNTIYVLAAIYLNRMNRDISLLKYKWVIAVNMVSSFGMLFTMIYGGYFWASTFFATMALLTSFLFAYFFWRDSRTFQDESKPWFLGGLFFMIISSLGIFSLGYMAATKSMTQNIFLASEYYYLHYQYNGFFIFSCIGFLLHSMKEAGAPIGRERNKSIFWLMFVGCLVGYGLSVLWMKLPDWVFALIVLATVAQTTGAWLLFDYVRKNWTQLVLKWSPMHRFVLMFSGFAFGVKILLQLGSNIPALNQFAFGFRNVVIAYLHLVLLMCIASFLLNQILATQFFRITKPLLTGFKLLLIGIFLNEVVLGLMGVLSIRYIAVPYANQALLAISLLMLTALVLMFINLRLRRD